jgi:hypothetical protein
MGPALAARLRGMESLRRNVATSVAGILVIVGLVSCTEEASAEEFCAALEDLAGAEQWEGAHAIVYFDVDADDDTIAAARDSIDGDPNVEDTQWVDQEEAFARFQEQFADRPEMIEAVGPDSLPAHVRVRLADPEAGFGTDPSSLAGVYDVVVVAELGPATVVDQLVRPLTLGGQWEQVTRLLTTLGGPVEGLAATAPDDLRDDAEVLELYWRDPVAFEQDDLDVAPSARRIAAFYDTECD